MKSTPILLLSSDDDIASKTGDLQLEAIIVKHTLQQISDQIINFLESHLDPLFYQGRILIIEDSVSIARMILQAQQQTGDGFIRRPA